MNYHFGEDISNLTANLPTSLPTSLPTNREYAQQYDSEVPSKINKPFAKTFMESFTLQDKTISVKKLIIIIVAIIFAYFIIKTYLNVIEIKYMLALNYAQLGRHI